MFFSNKRKLNDRLKEKDMLEKSCRWWPIWYLLFFCHGAEGQLQWVVKEKVSAYGQNLILFCPVENCCSLQAGWSVGSNSLILDVKTFSNDPKVKYHGTYNTEGFGVVIRNLSEADLNVTYHCVYGFNLSTPKYLLHGDVFRESTDQLQWVVKEKVTAYGQNLILLCPVENCCSEPAGWDVGPKSIISDVKTFSNDSKLKYGGTCNTDGFSFVIRNLSETDLNVTYHCVYGHNQSTPKYLLHGDVFRENVLDKEKEIDTAAIVGYIVATGIGIYIVVGIIIGIAYCVSRSRRTNKRQKSKESSSSSERDILLEVVAPGQPRNIKANVLSPKEIKVSWLPPTDSANIRSYNIYFNDSSVMEHPKNNYVLEGLIPDMVYHIQVSAITNGAEGEKSPMIEVKTSPLGSSEHDILTRTAREGVDALENNKIILLTGIDGIGKTFTAEKIIELYGRKHDDLNTLDLSNLRRFQVKLFNTLDLSNLRRFQVKLENYYFRSGKLIVFMDDFLANHYVKYLKENLDILKMVYRTKLKCPGTVEVVLTVENSCIEWCKKELVQCKIFSEVYLIDLNEEFNKTEDLQEQLLKVYLPGEDHLYGDIVEKYRTTQEPKIGFPELCYLFSKNQIFRDQGAVFFQDPSKSLNEYFMKLGSKSASEEENVFYIALVQIMMTNKIVVFDIPKAEINNMENMFNILYKKTLDAQSLERIIDTTNGGILIKTSENRDGMYVFQNPLILNFLFNSFNKIISPLGLENVLGFFTMEFIVDFVRTHLNVNPQSIYPNTVMVVEEESYPLLAVRIREIIFENGMESVYRLCLSPLLDDKKFLHILLEECGKHTERRSSDSSGGNDMGYFPAVLLESVIKYRPRTEIFEIVLDYMSRTLSSQSSSNVVVVYHRSVKFAMTEADKENCENQIEILRLFITKHNFYYSDR